MCSGGSPSATWSFQSACVSRSRIAAAFSGRAVPGCVAEVRVPEHVVPVGMRGEAGNDGLTQLAKIVRKVRHVGPRDARVDQQNAFPALHDGGIALDELALVDENALGDLRQHQAPSRFGP